MDKRYQVFVSSTFLDLKEERRQVMQALLKLNCIPAGMELFNATNQDQWDLIRAVIDDSDYYVVIVGARYGSMTDKNVSYTEKEYDYALERGKRVLGFVHANPGSIAADESEQTAAGRRRLAAFVKKVEKLPIVRFESAPELAGQVGLSVASEISKFPATGWVRGDQAMTPKASAEMSALRARIAELQLEQRIEKDSASSPREDVSGLQQGDDPVTVGFTMYVIRDNYETVQQAEHNLSTTWNRIIRALGPSMMEAIAEVEMGRRLGLMAAEANGYPASVQCSVHSASFDVIKVQLRALGLIERAGVAAHQGPTWKLSELGEQRLTEVMALRRAPVPNPDE